MTSPSHILKTMRLRDSTPRHLRFALLTATSLSLGCSSNGDESSPFVESAGESAGNEAEPSMPTDGVESPASGSDDTSSQPANGEPPASHIDELDSDNGDPSGPEPSIEDVAPDPVALPNEDGEPEPLVQPEALEPVIDPETGEPVDAEPQLADPPIAEPAPATPTDDGEPQGGQSGGDDGREPGCLEVRRTTIDDASVALGGATLPLADIVEGVVGDWPADVYQNLAQPMDGKTRELLGQGIVTFTAVEAPAVVIEFEPEEFTFPPGSDAASSGDGAETMTPPSSPRCPSVYSFELELHAEYATLFDTTLRVQVTTTTSELGAAPRFSGAVPLDEAGGTIWPTQFDPADFWAARLEISGEVIVGEGLIASYEEQGYRPDYAAVELVAYQEPFEDCEGSACDGIANRSEYPIRMALGERLSATR